MSEKYPTTDSAPNKREKKSDDARKFTVIGGVIDPYFLQGHNAVAHAMVVDWTVIAHDEHRKAETKIAYKEYDDGRVQILEIAKEKVGDARTAEKTEIAPGEYTDKVAQPIKHLAKRRYEFTYRQNGIDFELKYDVIEDGKLYLLEVDAPSPELRAQFDEKLFEYELHEVSGDPAYEGYEIVDTVATLDT